MKRAALLSVALLFGAFCNECGAQDRGRALGAEVLRIESGADRLLAWSPDEKYLISVSDRWLMSWDLSIGTARWKIPYNPYLSDNPISFLDGGARILIHYTRAQTVDDKSNHRYALSIVDAQSGRIVQDLQFDQPNPASANRTDTFDLSDDKRTLAMVLGRGGPVVAYDIATWSEVWRLPRVPGVAMMALDDRRNRLVLAQIGQGMIQTWQRSPASKLAEFSTYKTGLSRLVLDKTTGSIFTGGDGALRPDRPPIPGRAATFAGIEDDPDTLVRAWEPATGQLIRAYVGPGRNVKGLAVHPDGRYVIAVKSRALPTRSDGKDARDAYVLAWETATGRLVAASSYGQGFPNTVAFSPNGQRIALSADGRIQIIQLDPKLFP